MLADSEEQRFKWLEIEDKLKSKLVILPSSKDEQQLPETLLVGGADIGFLDDDPTRACGVYVVLKFSEELKEPQLIYQDVQMVDLAVPYIPGFLAFREAQIVVDMVQKQKNTQPDLTPSYLMVDGNGMLHPRKFGLACHIGVHLDMPTVGVAKKIYLLDDDEDQEDGGQKRARHKKRVHDQLLKAGDFFDVLQKDGSTVGITLRTTDKGTNPVYVSIGHKVSLDQAKQLAIKCSLHKIPEPTRQADLIGRQHVANLKNVDIVHENS